jgi:two-component system KDP operon response regulator KdpE
VDGLKSTACYSPALVTLDVDLADMSGVQVLDHLRSSSKSPGHHPVRAIKRRRQGYLLRRSGDDYLVKPFESDDLLMRSRLAIQNYLRPSAGNGISVGSLSMDVEACVVYIDGDQVELTPAEYRLLGILADRTDNVVTGHRLLEDLWGPLTNHRNLRCLSILVRDLRERIEPRPHRPRVVREFRSVIVLLNAETPQLPQSTIPCESVNARAKDARLGSKELVQGVYPLRSS